MLWKITPLFASWLSKPNNFLFGSSSSSSSSINAESSILELGCGISPLNAFALAPRVDRYILSDQPYVQRLIQQNLDDNEHLFTHSQKQQKLGKKKGAKSTATISSTSTSSNNGSSNISFTTLDWETESPTPALTGNTAQTRSFDAVLACDCVFNYALVQPFVQTCADVCKLRTQEEDESKPPTLCIVAQQLRNDEVFLSWLQTFYQLFRVWRVPDTMLPDGLQSKDGFVVHIGVLRESSIPQWCRPTTFKDVYDDTRQTSQ